MHTVDPDSTYIPKDQDDCIRCYPNGTRDLINAGWDGGGWYFWDELGLNIHGPFRTYEETLFILSKLRGNHSESKVCS